MNYLRLGHNTHIKTPEQITSPTTFEQYIAQVTTAVERMWEPSCWDSVLTQGTYCTWNEGNPYALEISNDTFNGDGHVVLITRQETEGGTEFTFECRTSLLKPKSKVVLSTDSDISCSYNPKGGRGHNKTKIVNDVRSAQECVKTLYTMFTPLLISAQ